jgi:hypothetical protein
MTVFKPLLQVSLSAYTFYAIQELMSNENSKFSYKHAREKLSVSCNTVNK